MELPRSNHPPLPCKLFLLAWQVAVLFLQKRKPKDIAVCCGWDQVAAFPPGEVFCSPVLAEEAVGEGNTPGGKAVNRSRKKALRGEQPCNCV